jgi:hypothetical protein
MTQLAGFLFGLAQVAPWYESPLLLVVVAALIGIVANRLEAICHARRSKKHQREVLLATLAGEIGVIHQEMKTLIGMLEPLQIERKATLARFPYLPADAYRANIGNLGVLPCPNLAYCIAMTYSIANTLNHLGEKIRGQQSNDADIRNYIATLLGGYPFAASSQFMLTKLCSSAMKSPSDIRTDQALCDDINRVQRLARTISGANGNADITGVT